jgi:type IV pilus assembly protein PilX
MASYAAFIAARSAYGMHFYKRIDQKTRLPMRSLHNTPASSSIKRRHPLHQQRGVSLVMVLIFLLLAIISVLGAFRSGFLNEKIVGNESDYNRAFAAAEALIRDAEIDIRGRRPPYDYFQADGSAGFPCRPTTDDGNSTETASKVGYEDSCRLRGAAATPWFPEDTVDFDKVQLLLNPNVGDNNCIAGICMPPNTTSLATIEDQILPVIGSNTLNRNLIGVPYGSFTRRFAPNNSENLTASQNNPLLATQAAAATAVIPKLSTNAWYVIEAFPYGTTFNGSGNKHPATQNAPAKERSFVYRITAVVVGLNTKTRVVLKSVFIPYPISQNP